MTKTDSRPWCPVCRLRVATVGNLVPGKQVGFYETFAEHGGCDGEGRRVMDADYGFAVNGTTVPQWEYAVGESGRG